MDKTTFCSTSTSIPRGHKLESVLLHFQSNSPANAGQGWAGCCSHWGSESKDERPLSVSLPLFLQFCLSSKYIFKTRTKEKTQFLKKKKKKHNARTKREIRQRFEFQENHKFHEDKYYIHSVSLCTFKDYLCVLSAKNRTSHLVAEQTNTC